MNLLFVYFGCLILIGGYDMRFYSSFRDLGWLVDVFLSDPFRGVLILACALGFCLVIAAFYASFRKK